MRVSRSMLMLRQACFETGSIKAGAWLRGHFSSFCCQSQQGELFRFFNLNCRVVHCLQSSFPPLLMNFLNWVEADGCKAGWREEQRKHDRSKWNGCHHVIFLLELLGYEFWAFSQCRKTTVFFFPLAYGIGQLMPKCLVWLWISMLAPVQQLVCTLLLLSFNKVLSGPVRVLATAWAKQ